MDEIIMEFIKNLENDTKKFDINTQLCIKNRAILNIISHYKPIINNMPFHPI